MLYLLHPPRRRKRDPKALELTQQAIELLWSWRQRWERIMPDNQEPKYEVGFQRPPRHTQFRKGTSGNPKGRPREAKNLAAVLDKALAEKVTIVENGRRRKITKRSAMIKQLVNKAASGDLRASRQLTDLEFRLNPEGVRQKSGIESAPLWRDPVACCRRRAY
jgi:Family of unknown function (DUF5681)